MTQARERTEAGNVSLYPDDWAIIDQADTNDAGRSATLRLIVREWNDWRQRMMIDSRVSYDAASKAQYITGQIPEGD